MNSLYLWSRLDTVGYGAMRLLLGALWQSSILLLAVGILGWLLRRRRASVRHALWVGALITAPLLPLLTGAIVRVGAPDLSASSLTLSFGDIAQSHRDAAQWWVPVGASGQVTVTLVIRNHGLADAPNASVHNPLPWPLRLIKGQPRADEVDVVVELPWENEFLWEGEVAVGEPVTLTYSAVAPPLLNEAIWLYNAARLEDG